MNSYVSKYNLFQAIQFTGDNRDAIIQALGCSKDACQSWTNADTKTSYLTLKGTFPSQITPGMWITSTNGKYNTIPQDMFARDYQQVWLKGV